MSSKIESSPYQNLLKFMSPSAAKPRVSVASTPDRTEAAKVIQMPMRQGVAKSAAESRPPVAITAKVEEYVGKLFPHLRGAMQQDMVAAISRKIAEDPHASKLIV